jgi:hypothetical protein
MSFLATHRAFNPLQITTLEKESNYFQSGLAGSNKVAYKTTRIAQPYGPLWNNQAVRLLVPYRRHEGCHGWHYHEKAYPSG